MAVLLWVSQASVTYDLHKCEWVSRASPSVFGVILPRSKIFYCAHSCQRLPQWCGDFSLPLVRRSCSIFRLPNFQAPDPKNNLSGGGPFQAIVVTGFGKQPNQCSITCHYDPGALPILEGQGTCQESYLFTQGMALLIKWDCVWGCVPGYRMF